MSLPLFVRLWFAVDLVVTLLPQIHWAAGSAAPAFGAPCVLIYLFGTSACIAASIVAAYLSDAGRRA